MTIQMAIKADVREVDVVDCVHDRYLCHRGSFGAYAVPVRTIRLVWSNRTPPVRDRHGEGDDSYYVDNWKRVDGREETYADALNEAELNGLNPGLAEERGVYRAWLSLNGYGADGESEKRE